MNSSRDVQLELLDKLPSPVWRSGTDAKCDYFNKAWLRFTGRTLQQELGDGWATGVHPDDLAGCLQTYREAFAARRPFMMEYRLRRADGSYGWIVDCGSPYYDPDDQFAGYIGAGTDITARKLAELERARLAAIVESSDDAIISKSLDGHILSWNAGAERLYGYAAHEVIGRQLSILMPPDMPDELPAILDRLERGEHIRHYETERCRKDGGRIHVSLAISPVKDARGGIVGASAVARDISERKQAEAERERLFREIETARNRLQLLSLRMVDTQEAERRRIAGELHDEIGQQLTALKLHLRMSESRPAAEMKNSLCEAERRVDELLAQVRNLSLDLRPTMLDDLGLLPALLWHFERFTLMTGVRVNFRHSNLEGRRFPKGIETGAYRTVQEALTNVARHAGVLNATVTIWADDETLGVQVEDHGKGFDAETCFSVASTGGLSGMRERARCVDGELTVESAPSQGTCVTAEFPLGQMGTLKGRR